MTDINFSEIRTSLVGVPKSQVVTSAGDLGETKLDASAWNVVDGLKLHRGWGLCDGSTFDETKYPELYTALGNSNQVPNGPYRTRVLTQNEVTITTSIPGLVVANSLAFFIFYTDNNGKWRMKFNFRGSNTSQSAGYVFTITVGDVVFSSLGNQAITSVCADVDGTGGGWCSSNSNDLNAQHESASAETNLSGDIALESKPTIANFDTYLESYPVIAAYDNVLSSSIGLPEATREGKGLLSLNQNAEGNRNYIINGGFDFWQRATSQTASGYGSVDRFTLDATGTTDTLSQQPFTVGQTDIPQAPKFYMRNVVSSVAGANNRCRVRHKIEGVEQFSGKTVTLSFYAKADAAKNISTELVQLFGSGGSPSAAVEEIGVTSHALDINWKLFKTTFTVPSIAGKTLGTDGNDAFDLNIWLDAGSNFDARTNSLGQQSGTFDIAQIKLEEGTEASKFTRAGGTYAGELALCQRYYWKSGTSSSYNGDIDAWWGDTTSGNTYVVPVKFPVKMRSIPTTSIISQSVSASDFGVVALTSETENGGLAGATASATGAAHYFRFVYDADAEL